MGKIMDTKNDIVLTPPYVAELMAKILKIDNESNVIDPFAGTGNLLKAVRKQNQEALLSGIELNEYVYQELEKETDGLNCNINNLNATEFNYSNFNRLIANPPYSEAGAGFEMIKDMMNEMKPGYAVVLTMDSAGNNKGLPYTKEILKNNTLLATIKMSDIFKGFASVATSIYLFQVGRPHEEQDIVKFINFENDGYKRSGRKAQKGNHQNVDMADERYKEVANLVLHGKEYLNLLNEDDYIEDTITLEGNDWNYSQHRKLDLTPTVDDFKNTVKTFIDWKAKEQQEAFGQLGIILHYALENDPETADEIIEKIEEIYDLVGSNILNKKSMVVKKLDDKIKRYVYSINRENIQDELAKEFSTLNEMEKETVMGLMRIDPNFPDPNMELDAYEMLENILRIKEDRYKWIK